MSTAREASAGKPGLLRGTVTGMALGALAHGVGTAFLAVGGSSLTPEIQLADAVVWCLAGGVAGAAMRAGRPLARSLAVLPALLAAVVMMRGGVHGLLILAAGWMLFAALAAPRGAVLATLAGAIAGNELLFFERTGYAGSATTLPALAVFAVAICSAAGLLLLSRFDFGPRLDRGAAAFGAAGLVLALALTDRPQVPAAAAGPPGGRPVVLIVLDTLRADHLAIHGHPDDPMPRLDRFARQQAIVIDRSLANAPASLPTHASIFTGLIPPRHGANYPSVHDPSPPQAYPLEASTPTIATLLQQAGYWTAGVAANHGTFDPHWGLRQGFDFFEAARAHNAIKEQLLWSAALLLRGPQQPLERVVRFLDRQWPFDEAEFFEWGASYRRGAYIADQAIRAVDAAGDRSFFLFLNFFDPHGPLWPPASFRDQPPILAGGLSIDELKRILYRDERDLTNEERDDIRALYDADLRYLDGHLARVLERLREHPAWEDMLIVITSDHGESLGEHRAFGHALTLYDSELWVPMILKPAKDGPEAPARWSTPFQSVDIFATIAEHAGLRTPEVDGLPWGRGRTLSQAWAGVWKLPQSYTERFSRNLQAAERDGWKLIRETRSDDSAAELYAIPDDPNELDDRAERDPARTRAMSALLGSEVEMPTADVDEVSPDLLDRLRELGYAQ